MDTSDSAYAEKRALVFQAYKRSLDLDVALTLVTLTEADKIQLMDDRELEAQIAIEDAKQKEEIFNQYRELAKTTTSDGVRAQMLKELGKTINPKRFADKDSGASSTPKQIAYKLIQPLTDEEVEEVAARTPELVGEEMAM